MVEFSQTTIASTGPLLKAYDQQLAIAESKLEATKQEVESLRKSSPA